MSEPTASDLAAAFHEAYERLAPEYGYETRKESAVPWEDVPENNRRLMEAVVAEVCGPLVARVDTLTRERELHEALDEIGDWKNRALAAEAALAEMTADREDARAMTRIANSRAAELRRALADTQRALKRAIYLAEHLFEMVPQGVWRDSGGDDMQGHYEGDYHAEKVAEELRVLADGYEGEETSR